MSLHANCFFFFPYGWFILQMLTKPRAWIHQSILHPVPGALGSTPLSCSLDKGIKFLCSQAWIKACNATGCKVTQHKPFPMPKGSQSKYKWPKQAYTASPKHTGQKAADQLLWPCQKQRVLSRDLKADNAEFLWESPEISSLPYHFEKLAHGAKK